MLLNALRHFHLKIRNFFIKNVLTLQRLKNIFRVKGQLISALLLRNKTFTRI